MRKLFIIDTIDCMFWNELANVLHERVYIEPSDEIVGTDPWYLFNEILSVQLKK